MKSVSDRADENLAALALLRTAPVAMSAQGYAERLADELLKIFPLDFIYLRFRGDPSSDEIQVARTSSRPASDGLAGQIADVLTPSLQNPQIATPQSVTDPLGDGMTQIMVLAMGFDLDEGMLVAGSKRIDSLTEEDCLLLRIGAYQTAMMLQRRCIAEALREREARFRGTFENAAVGVAHMTADCQYLRVNQKVCDIFGYSRDELEGKFCAQITHVHDIDVGVNQFDALMRGEISSFSAEKRYLRKDGSPVWVNMSVSLQRNSNNEPEYAIELIQDISDRKQTEEALQSATARIEHAVRGSDIGIWEIELSDGDIRQGRFDFTNVWEQLGYKRPEYPADFSTVIALVHPDEQDRIQQATQAYIDGKTSELEFEYRMRHKDGTYRWMLTRGIAVHDSHGARTRLIGSSIDITERKRAEQSLRTSEVRFRRYFELGLIGMAITSPTMGCIEVNDKICHILGYSRTELLKKTWAEMTHPDDLSADIAKFNSVVAGETNGYSLEKRWIRKDGEIVDSIISVKAVRDADGAIDYFVALLQDVTEQKMYEIELQRAKDVAEAANRSKDEFLANVSHEIRTPLNAILGMTDLVLESRLTDEQRQDLDTVKSAGENLLRVVSDLLDFSKIAAGKLELTPVEFGLRDTIRSVLTAQAVPAQKKELELVYHVQPDVPDLLIGDAGRLRQVLLNLVGNAIKFTDYGEVKLLVDVVGRAAPSDQAHLRFVVSDTGIGISPDKQQTVFEAFEQEDTSTTRRYGGTGLGLTISARLVALLGGKLNMESEPGRGTTLTFSAIFNVQPSPAGPLSLQRRPPPEMPQPPPLWSSEAIQSEIERASATKRIPLRILVVEDNEFNSRHIDRLLRRSGHQVQIAATGREALRILQIRDPNLGSERTQFKYPTSTSPAEIDLLLLDLHIPELDGFGVVKAIRNYERIAGGHLPVIALTARARKEDRDECLAAGMDGYLPKPLRRDDLFTAIEQLSLGHRVAPAAQHNHDQKTELIDPHVLLTACGGDAALLRDLCTDFREFMPARMAEVNDALRAQDATQLREAAHKLCGLLAAFSTVAGNAASELESCAAAGQIRQGASLAQGLDRMIKAVLVQIGDVTLEKLHRQSGNHQ
jgi:PAS domain S-box-containing protein